MTLLQFLVILLFVKLLSGTFSYSNQIDSFKSIENIIEVSLDEYNLHIDDDTTDHTGPVSKSLIDELLMTAIFTAVIISNKNHLIAQSDKTVQSPPPK